MHPQALQHAQKKMPFNLKLVIGRLEILKAEAQAGWHACACA